jgi:cytochrome c5
MRVAWLVTVILFGCAITPVRADDVGKLAFKARCAKCHGESGTGTFMLGRRLGKEKALIENRSDLTPTFIRHVVRNGIVSMPALTRVEVTDDELRAISDYLTKSRS